MNLRYEIFEKEHGIQRRTIFNYLTGTVPEDGWGMTMFNIGMLSFCVGLLTAIFRELS